jgi:hypothetical protein
MNLRRFSGASNMTSHKFAVTACAILTTLSFGNAARAQFDNVTSGMLLGIYASPAQGGLCVRGFIPGYSAETVLRHGDVLMRGTSDGATFYPIRSLRDMETMKSSIGPNVETALEIYRPSEGYVYAMVTFTPLYGPAAAAGGQQQVKAVFQSEQQKPRARQLFQQSRGGKSGPQPGQGLPQPGPRRSGGSSRAAALFGR